MRDSWVTVRLGDVLRRRTDRLGDRAEPRILTCTEGHGLVDQMLHLGRRVASRDVRAYKIVGAHDVVYNVYLLWLGAIGQNTTGLTCITSPVYEVFSPVGDVEPRYLALLLQSPQMVERYGAISIGTVPRRRRAPWEDFVRLQVELPPLAEQRRIVDLISAIDDTLAAAEDTLKGASRLLDSLREDFYVTGSMPSKPLGALVTMRSGPSWKATDESPSKKEGYAPVLGITNTPAGRRLDLLQQKFVRGLSGTVMRLNDSSLIMIRTNGNRARIGNVYRATAAVAGYAVSAFQIAIEPTRVTDSPFLYWILGTPSIQQRISEAASGSTGLGNVAIGWLKELVVPYSEGSVRVADFVETCEAIAAVADEAQVEANSLQVLRSELLTALLSGDHATPESYDELLGA